MDIKYSKLFMIRRYNRCFYTLSREPGCYRIYENKRNRGTRSSWAYQVQMLLVILLGISVVYQLMYITYIVNIREYAITSSLVQPKLLKFLRLRTKVSSEEKTILHSNLFSPVNITRHHFKTRKKRKDLPQTNLSNISLTSYQLEVSSDNNLEKGLTYPETLTTTPQVNQNVSSKLCRNSGENLQLFVAVTSAPSRERARLAVRQTWGHFASRRDIAIAFIVGSTTNSVYETRLKREEYLFQDIIRGQFLDSYGDSTAKTISALKWININCFKATFVLKVTDDMFINIPRLLTFISTLDTKQKAIYGRLATKWMRQRYEKIIEYKPGIFPDFIVGPTYLFPTRLSSDLYFAAINHAYVKFDNVFLTGIIANDLQIERIHVPEFFNRHLVLTACNVERIISIRIINKSEQFDLWTKLFKDRTKC